MKIEKVNDNQIRCTLTKEDLADRHLKLSELAYGTEKAKHLFHDMMQQANYEFGFETEDLPIMVEAVPVASGSVILVITKVEYPDELDTRFSKFSNSDDDSDEYRDERIEEMFAESADDILGLFRKIAQETHYGEDEDFSDTENDSVVSQPDNTVKKPAAPVKIPENVSVPVDLTKLFVFRRLDDITRLAHILKDFYDGDNTLYKDEQNHRYFLVLHKSSLSPEIFNKVCNILSEYAHQKSVTPAAEAFFTEHYTTVCSHRALQTFWTL